MTHSDDKTLFMVICILVNATKRFYNFPECLCKLATWLWCLSSRLSGSWSSWHIVTGKQEYPTLKFFSAHSSVTEYPTSLKQKGIFKLEVKFQAHQLLRLAISPLRLSVTSSLHRFLQYPFAIWLFVGGHSIACRLGRVGALASSSSHDQDYVWTGLIAQLRVLPDFKQTYTWKLDQISSPGFITNIFMSHKLQSSKPLPEMPKNHFQFCGDKYETLWQYDRIARYLHPPKFEKTISWFCYIKRETVLMHKNAWNVYSVPFKLNFRNLDDDICYTINVVPNHM